MKRLVRLISVLVFVLAMAVPTFAVGGCPDVYISTDGGATWSQCDFNGGIIHSDGSTDCYYTCYI
jgi:hypothetical protein